MNILWLTAVRLKLPLLLLLHPLPLQRTPPVAVQQRECNCGTNVSKAASGGLLDTVATSNQSLAQQLAPRQQHALDRLN